MTFLTAFFIECLSEKADNDSDNGCNLGSSNHVESVVIVDLLQSWNTFIHRSRHGSQVTFILLRKVFDAAHDLAWYFTQV